MYVMYDDVTTSLIPASAQAVAGYVDGNFVTKASLEAGWPKAKKVLLTVNGSSDADGIDSEPGDASSETVVRWVKNKMAAQPGFKPVVYASLSGMQAILNDLAASGVPREQVRVWTAHYNGVAHICTPACGFGFATTADATQWTDKALGRSLDESLVASDFFGPVVPPKPVDPHHYLRFQAEREHVKAYDRLRKHPLKNRKALKGLRAALLLGAKRIAREVIKDADASPPPNRRDWSVNHRGWRYSQLIHRANGKRIVR